MTEIRDMAEFRPPGARNFIRIGDMVRADPPIGRSFLGTVISLHHLDGLPLDGATPNRVEVGLCVRQRLNGNDHPQAGMARTVNGDRVRRLAQKRHEVRS